ncbi:hypothetical protein HKCCE3408_05885 [Rhodobacterales bacterium HKCCE3408]|nr:hypothetical protein [Rhodobacterales bacterium HKCCE3408]
MTDRDPADPKGLIRESYRIEGITEPECRSIFVDWALSTPGDDPKRLIAELLTRYRAGAEDHPMTRVLTEGLEAPKATGRRGGRAARVPPGD